MQKENTRRIGARKERLVCEWLEQRGYRILERNFTCRTGEIDLVAREGGYLVFVEVKYRGGLSCGTPEEAVDWRKQRKISRTALFYLARYGYAESTPVRFDVVSVSGEEPVLYRNAFEFCGA